MALKAAAHANGCQREPAFRYGKHLIAWKGASGRLARDRSDGAERGGSQLQSADRSSCICWMKNWNTGTLPAQLLDYSDV
jgi:hypothetical protein